MKCAFLLSENDLSSHSCPSTARKKWVCDLSIFPAMTNNEPATYCASLPRRLFFRSQRLCLCSRFGQPRWLRSSSSQRVGIVRGPSQARREPHPCCCKGDRPE